MVGILAEEEKPLVQAMEGIVSGVRREVEEQLNWWTTSSKRAATVNEEAGGGQEGWKANMWRIAKSRTLHR